MQTSPLRDSSQSPLNPLWGAQTCPAPAQSVMGHSPPMFPYGHSPLRAAVQAQDPPQALAASCWLQSQGLPQLGRQPAQQLQHHQPEVGLGPGCLPGWLHLRPPVAL